MTVDKQLWISARNLADSSVNLTHLWDTLLKNLKLEANLKVIDDSSTENVDDWVEAAPEMYLNVYQSKAEGKGRPTRKGSLTICVQLTCDRASGEARWKFGDISKVVVCYSPVNDDHWEFGITDPDSSGRCEDAVAKKYHWEADEAVCKSNSQYSETKPWFYAVPLSNLDGMGSIKRLISEPVSSMIVDGDPDTVLKEIAKEICIPPKK